MTEDIKCRETRVNVAESGFLIEFDFDYKSSNYYFSTDYNNWYFTFKYPDDDEMLQDNFNEAKEYMNRFETLLYSNDFKESRSYTQLIDEESFAKWYYQKNLLQMDECNRYYFKFDDTEDTKLKMGPLWDFEWCLGNACDRNAPEHYLENKLYFKQICKDEAFMKSVASVHAKYGEDIYSEVLKFYETLTDSLKESQAENFKRWDILNLPIALSKTPLGSWEKEVEFSKEFFITHYNWLDKVLSEYNTSIYELDVDKASDSHLIYNIYGQLIDGIPTTPGIYILNGKKYTLPNLLNHIYAQ